MEYLKTFFFLYGVIYFINVVFIVVKQYIKGELKNIKEYEVGMSLVRSRFIVEVLSIIIAVFVILLNPILVSFSVIIKNK